jgi:hypothetical protein
VGEALHDGPAEGERHRHKKGGSMTTSHHFDDENNITSGYFADDFGRVIFRYRYDRESKVLRVNTSAFRRKLDLSQTGIDRLSEPELTERLKTLALEIGEDLRGNPPVK